MPPKMRRFGVGGWPADLVASPWLARCPRSHVTDLREAVKIGRPAYVGPTDPPPRRFGLGLGIRAALGFLCSVGLRKLDGLLDFSEFWPIKGIFFSHSP